MTRRMFRYLVRIDDQPHAFNLSCGGYSGPLHVAATHDHHGVHAVEFWAEYDLDAYGEEARTFQVFGTGQPLADGAHWVGTCDRTPDGLVWHLYELDGEPT